MTEEDWSAVPSDLLELISRRLLSWDDYVRFRSVCASWRSAAPKRPHLPLILLRLRSHSLKLCNFPDTELYSPPRLPQRISSWDHRICGSSRGWICSVVDKDPVYLHNPFTGDEIRLPVLPNRAFPGKVILSSDPAEEDHSCVVMANCLNRLMFHCRPGDASWTPALADFPNGSGDYIEDVIFYQNKFYAVSHRYRLFACHVGPHDARFTEILPADTLFTGGKPMDTGTFTLKFLVVSSGDLLLVQIISTTRVDLSVCEVFRVDLDDGQFRLFKLENLPGRALFLSQTSMCFSVDASSANSRCRGNCIYYAGGDPKISVLNMEDNSISSLADTFWPFNAWLTPSMFH